MSYEATVTTASPLTVTMTGDDEAIPALTLGSYAPVEGDRVAVDRLGSQVVVLGATNASEWVYPALGNSWVNYGGGLGDVGYRLMADGDVQLDGVVKSGTPGAPIFTLPVGYRPLTGKTFVCACSAGMVHMQVATTGIVQTVAYYAGGTNAYIYLSGIRFSRTT